MATRVLLTLGDNAWPTHVTGDTVTLETGESFALESSGERIRASSSSGDYAGNAVAAGDSVWVTIDGEVFVFDTRPRARHDRRGGRDQTAFTPPMPATVVRVAVKPGQSVRAGDVLISLEAMKMELPIRAPRDGVVRAVHCREGELVQPEQSLLDFE